MLKIPYSEKSTGFSKLSESPYVLSDKLCEAILKI